MRWSFGSLAALAVFVGASGCRSSTTPAPTTSMVEGQLTMLSYATPPATVTAVDESGTRMNAGIGADGEFTFDLPRGHLYRLFVAGSGWQEPVVFPRQGGQLDTNFRISGSGALVSLGRVRHYERAPSNLGGSSYRPTTNGSDYRDYRDYRGNDDDVQDRGGCESQGQLQLGLGTRCIDPVTTCENGRAPSIRSSTCRNGLDTRTGMRCTSEDRLWEEIEADPRRPMSLPENNAPNEVAGCEDDE